MDAGKHPIIEQRVGLSQIDDVEFGRLISSKVRHFEIEPLRIAFSIEVVLQD